MIAVASDQIPRILVIGSTAHPRGVDTHSGNTDGYREHNIADYDVVIFNLCGASDCRPVAGQLWRLLLLSEAGECWFVGDVDAGTFGGVPIVECLPVAPKLHKTNGDAFAVTPAADDSIQAYMRLVRSYTWFAENDVHPAKPTQIARHAAGQVIPGFHGALAALAMTKTGGAVAARIGVTSDGKSYRWVYLLPAPTEMSAEDAINLLLAKRYGIATQQQEPEWADQFELPNEKPHRDAIARAQAEIAKLNAEVESRKREWDAERRFRRLLFEKDETLELLVRETLEILGATVESPKRRGGNDGVAIDPAGRRYVLEIKGRGGSMGKDDARQGAHHVTEVRTEDGNEAYGLFIANDHCALPLDSRSSGGPFEQNGLRAAKIENLRVVRTSQLFEALRQKQLGEFDPTAFWAKVFAANPLAELPLPMATDSSDAVNG